MKTIAFYLPQFHEVAENSKWWGEGYTEWVSVREAKSLYPGHYQPTEPLNDEYYGAGGAARGWREPPVRVNGSTPFVGLSSYLVIAGSNPYTSLIERSLDGSILSISIL